MEVELRFEANAVKIHRFGTGNLKQWTVLRPGDVDRLTGWSFEELRRLDEGIWEFQAAARTNPHTPVIAGV